LPAPMIEIFARRMFCVPRKIKVGLRTGAAGPANS
jgi:hypothetical protein